MDAGADRAVVSCAEDGGRALHARLLRRDPTAPADLVAGFLGPLVAWLRRTFPRVDETLLEDVAADLLLSLGERPEQYDPARAPLPAYLRMAARADVRNARVRERREAGRVVPLDSVELRPTSRNSTWQGHEDPADVALAAPGDARLTRLRPHFDAREWEIVELMADGERSTERFAEILGLQGRPREEQAREVKRAKDRLKKRLQRLRQGVMDDG